MAHESNRFSQDNSRQVMNSGHSSEFVWVSNAFLVLLKLMGDSWLSLNLNVSKNFKQKEGEKNEREKERRKKEGEKIEEKKKWKKEGEKK